MDIQKRVQSLREWMQQHQLSAYIIPSNDPHCGEYVPAHWGCRKWVSGFTGSAGIAVVTLQQAALWTDSRYFIQARVELKDTEFQLMKQRVEGTPSIAQWLKSILNKGDRVGVCGEIYTYSDFWQEQQALSPLLELVATEDPFATLWTDRPILPTTPVYPQPLEWAGLSAATKLQNLRQEMGAKDVQGILICMLDEVAWMTNLRGSDVPCNPVFDSYLWVTSSTATLLIDPQKVPQEIQADLQHQGISINSDIRKAPQLAEGAPVWLDPDVTNYDMYQLLQSRYTIQEAPSPVITAKAIKNEAEIRGFHQAMLVDGIAMTKFLHWLKPAVKAGGQTEMSVCRQLDAFRSEYKGYEGVSFDTIAGYQAHGAIVHYEPTDETDIPLHPEGFLLLDSGGQYPEGTTDITRTIALGPVGETMKRDYTLILKGFIQLGLTKFPEGTCGTQLDVLARQPIWSYGLNYFHGTGHGVGAHLCCHEGPHQIRMNNMPAPLKAGMTVTDEPGLYIEGEYGIRTEDTLLITPYLETEFGKFLQFEHLTLCPIDTTPIVKEMLSKEEIDWLNQYHQHVYKQLAPHLTTELATWLREATQAI